ncbi:MAG: universal stress protein [Phototrophicales bacterium]
MLQKVLVPLDESSFAEQAIPFAQRLLAPEGKLIIMTVVEENNNLFSRYKFKNTDSIKQEMIDHATEYLKQLGAMLRKDGRQIEAEIRVGAPSVGIIEAARDYDVDAIVMSTRGQSDFNRLLIGSVTQKVLSEALCPVVVVPAKTMKDNL